MGFSKKEYFELSDMLNTLVGYDISQQVGYDNTRGMGLGMTEKSTSGNNIYNKFNNTHKNKNKKKQHSKQQIEQPKKPIVISGYKSVYVYEPKGIYVLDFGDGSNRDDYKELVTKAEEYYGIKEASSISYNGYLCSDGFTYRQSKNDKRIIVKCNPETDEELEVFLDASSMSGLYALYMRSCIDREYLKIGFQPYYHPPTYYYYNIYTKEQTTVPRIIFPVCSPNNPNNIGLPSDTFRLYLTSSEDYQGHPYGESYDIQIPTIFCNLIDMKDTYNFYPISGAHSFKLENDTYIITSLYGIYKFDINTRAIEQLYSDDSYFSTNYTKVDKYIYFTKRATLYRFNLDTNIIDFSIGLPLELDTLGECGFTPYEIELYPAKDFVFIKVMEGGGYNTCGSNTPVHFDTFYLLVDIHNIVVGRVNLPYSNSTPLGIIGNKVLVFKTDNNTCLEYDEDNDCEEYEYKSIFSLFYLKDRLMVELAPMYNVEDVEVTQNAINFTGMISPEIDTSSRYSITSVDINKELTLCPIKVKNYVCHIYNENNYHIIRFSNGKTAIVHPKDTPAEPIELKIKVENEVGTAPLRIFISDESKYKFSKFLIYFGDGSLTMTNKLDDISHTYFSAGHYNLVIYGYLFGTIYTYTTTIFVNNKLEPPVSKFSVSKQSEYVGRNIEFENLSTGGFDSLLWDFGDGSTSTSLNPVHTYTSSGLYIVTLYIYSDNQVASKFSQTIQIKDLKKLIINPTNFRLKIGSTAGFNGKFSIPSFKLTTGLYGNSHIYKKNDSNLPTITLGNYPSFIFKGKEIDFYANATDNPFYIKWDIDNHILYGNHIKYTFNTQGTFNITVSAENAAGVSSINFSVVVFSKIVEAGVFKYYYTLYTDINKVFIYNAFNNEFYRSIGGLGSTIGKFNKPTSLTVINPM